MKIRLSITCLLAMLSACASMGSDYTITDPTEQEARGPQLVGHWTSNSDLRITLIWGVFSGAKLQKDSLKAEVSGDLIHIHLIVVQDESATDAEKAALCAHDTKLTYSLHNLPHADYRIELDAVQYGEAFSWDIQPLLVQ